MNHHTKLRPDPDEDGPSPSDLTAIEAEWPLIAAELDVVAAECRLVSAGPHGPSELDWRHWRRAQRRVLRVAARLATTRPTGARRPATRRAA